MQDDPINLYEADELLNIQKLIQTSMESHLQLLIENKVDSVLKAQIMKYHEGCKFSFQHASMEVNLCLFYNQLKQRYQLDQDKCREQILKMEIGMQELNHLLKNKDAQLISRKNEIETLNQAILHQAKRVNILQHQLYLSKDNITLSKQQHLQELSRKDQQLNNKQATINLLNMNIQELKQRLEAIQQQSVALIDENQVVLEQLLWLETKLQQDIDKYSTNLMTLNIETFQLTQTHQQQQLFFNKQLKIFEQNRRLIQTIKLINTKLQPLCSIQPQLQVYIPHFGQVAHFQKQSDQIISKIQKYSKESESVVKIIVKQKETLAVQAGIIEKLHQQQGKLKYEIQQSQKIKDLLQCQLRGHKQESYTVILDLQRSRTDLETKITKLTQQFGQKQAIFKSHSMQLSQAQKLILFLQNQLKQSINQAQSLSTKVKERQLKCAQLAEDLANIKSNLDLVMKTEEDQDNTDYNLVQQLIDKNNQTSSQLSAKKIQQDLLNQKINQNQHIIDHLNLQLEEAASNHLHLTYQLRSVKEEIQRNKRISQQQTTLVEELKQVIQAQKELITKYKQYKSPQSNFIEASIQTDIPIGKVISSRIRRQINNQSNLKSQVEKSHSLLSEREQNKQNNFKDNYEPKIKVKNSCKEQCTHQSKIYSLNQIINYMMNYLKGSREYQIKSGSWFSHQIHRYGKEYELKLKQLSQVQSRTENMRFVTELCNNEPNCHKLIKQFESIAQFYIARQKSPLNQTVPIVQQKLNKTVCKNNNRHIYG